MINKRIKKIIMLQYMYNVDYKKTKLPSPIYSITKSPLLIDSAASTPQPQSSVCEGK